MSSSSVNKNVKQKKSVIIIWWADVILSKVDIICPFAVRNQISTISMHILSLVKIYLKFTKVIVGKWKYRHVVDR